jgi:hypothetical protein
MNTIDNTLAKHGLTPEELPKKISNKITHIADTEDQLAATKAELEVETDEEVKLEMVDTIDKATAYLEEFTEQVVSEIEAFVLSKQSPPDDANPPIVPTPAPKPVTETHGNEAPKKKGAGALPWVIGLSLLVVTLGAVNVMREK